MSALGPIECEVRDISVRGAQIYVLGSSFALAETPTLLQAALAVREVLASRFTVMLDRGHVGEIHRVAGLARLVLPSHAPGCIELGCEFDEPLSEREMLLLTGGVRPSRSTDVEPAGPRESEAAPAAPVPPSLEDAAVLARNKVTNPYRVFVSGAGPDAPPLVCRARGLDKDGLRIRVSGTAMKAADATQAAVEFMRRYGEQVKIKITDGPRHLWTGRADVFGLEVKLTRPDELVISVGYGRALRPAELERMGLNIRVA